MESRELNSMIGGYVAGNVISKSIANELQKEIDKNVDYKNHHPLEKTISAQIAKYVLSKNIDGAYDFLNNTITEEFIHFAQNQKDFPVCLADNIELVKKKYSSIYERIGRVMPNELQEVTDSSLCNLLGIQVLRTETIQNEEFYRDKVEQGEMKSSRGIILCLIFIVLGLLVFFLIRGIANLY